MAKYINQDIFDMCAVMALKISYRNDKPISETSITVADAYKNTYADVDLIENIETAAKNIKQFIEDNLPSGSMVDNCTQLQFCIHTYNPDGTKKKKKIFGGTMFTSEKHPIPDKVEKCSRNLLLYHMHIMNGVIPIVPKNWSMR